jgi:hypothetical protein
MDAVRAATDERDRGNGEPLAQWGAPIPAAGDDVWGTGDWERDVRIAEEGSGTQKKFEEVPRASTWLAS